MITRRPRHRSWIARLLDPRVPAVPTRDPVSWTVEAMERRLLLAADAGVSVSAVSSGQPAETSESTCSDSTSVTAVEIAFVDARATELAVLADLADEHVEVVLIDDSGDPLDQMTRVIRGRQDIQAIHLISHGQSGRLEMGGQRIDQAFLATHADQLQQWRQSMSDSADILIYGCDVAADAAGRNFVERFAELTAADVAASVDRSGSGQRANWTLEHTVGVVGSDLIASVEALDRTDVVLPISIRAAGTTNEEQMQLQIDGVAVQTWNDIGGDAYGRQFVEYTYDGDTSGVIADQVRVVFTNDLYEPDQGIDRNLRIDSITIDGETFETEDPSVFSTGVWKPEDGIQPGFREDEMLAADGYFQYAGGDDPGGGGDGSLIEIYAAGNENSEQMQLWLDGSRAQTWNNIGGDAFGRDFVRYAFTADTTVDADDVQIRFTNDLYVNDGEVDRNLRVDRIVIDGTTFQTEDPSVFSNGTWEDGGVTPGFKQNETLHVDGYFQYAGGGGPADEPGTLALETSNVTVNEDGGSVRLRVIRSDGSDGAVTIDYATQPGTAVAGDDYTDVSGTLSFANGETVKNIDIPIVDDQDVEGVEQFNVTIDNVVGGATLLVPRTATVTINDDEAALPDYADFASLAGLNLNGDARGLNDFLELTQDTTQEVGSAFFESPISLASDGSFRSAFRFQATGGSGGADGLTFTVQNDSRGVDAIGAAGGQLGYQGIANSVAVEFDTYRNTDGIDVDDNHVSIIQGTVSNVLRTKASPVDFNSGSTVYAWVDYNGTSDVMAVYVSASADKPELALMKTTVDLEAIVGDEAYVGFTAATGGRSNSHRIRSWTLDQQAPPQDPPTEVGDTVVANDLITGLNQPTAVDWLPDGTMLIAQKGGVVRTASGGSLAAGNFIDISDQVNGVRDRGLLDIAVHPDFANNPYVYLLFTYDPPEAANQPDGSIAGRDGKGNRAGRLIRVTADAANDFKTAVAGSEVVLAGSNSTWDNFNAFANSTTDFDEPPAGENPDGTYVRDFINSDSESHTIGGLAFAPDGALFVSIGDGASYNRVDVRADRVQDIDSLSGKILRIDPITGQGLPDNPFYNGDGDANRSKVYQSGLRNPFRISVDSATGQLYIGDVGWTKWEEVNAAGPGANFGWPYYEGGSGVSLEESRYAATPEGQAFLAQNIPVDASIYALNHQADGINAIVMGDVYRGSLYGSEYQGDVFFNDLGQGIVRHASLDGSGNVTDVSTFTTGANVVVAISEGPDGALYYVDLNDSKVGRWELV